MEKLLPREVTWKIYKNLTILSKVLEINIKSTYAKVHGSVSVDALQRKEAEESACGEVNDPAFKISEIYYQENITM